MSAWFRCVFGVWSELPPAARVHLSVYLQKHKVNLCWWWPKVDVPWASGELYGVLTIKSDNLKQRSSTSTHVIFDYTHAHTCKHTPCVNWMQTLQVGPAARFQGTSAGLVSTASVDWTVSLMDSSPPCLSSAVASSRQRLPPLLLSVCLRSKLSLSPLLPDNPPHVNKCYCPPPCILPCCVSSTERVVLITINKKGKRNQLKWDTNDLWWCGIDLYSCVLGERVGWGGGGLGAIHYDVTGFIMFIFLTLHLFPARSQWWWWWHQWRWVHLRSITWHTRTHFETLTENVQHKLWFQHRF